MKVKRTPDETILTLPGTISEEDLLDIISYLQNKIGYKSSVHRQQNTRRISSGDYNWWKENQLFL